MVRTVDGHFVLTQSVRDLSTLSSESSCADSVKEQTETIYCVLGLVEWLHQGKEHGLQGIM